MNSKKKFFIFFNLFLIIAILAINNFILLYFGEYEYIFLISSTISILIYLILNKTLIDDVFQIDSKLKYKIEKTMHELNTPISTIEMNSAILKTKLKDEANLKRLDRINLACKNLLKLYEDMEYSIKKEIDRVEIVSFDLSTLIVDCIDKFKDIKNSVNITTDIGFVSVRCDKNGFQTVIENLISNSLKHNKNIKNINFRLDSKTLIVSDDGEGIKSDEIYKIFDRFFQVEENSEGFGLGLFIIKEYCDKYKIDIKIDSSNSGTTFYLNLSKIME